MNECILLLKFFTQQEFDALSIRNLQMDNFIVSEGFYFKPFQAVAWPDDSVKHPYGTYGQPLCACCKKYGLDHRTISEDLYYVCHEASSTIQCFNGKRDVGRDNAGADSGGMRLDDFCKLKEAIEAKLTEAMVAALRFYTSHSFAAINNALRDSNRTTQCLVPRSHRNAGLQLLLHAHAVREDDPQTRDAKWARSQGALARRHTDGPLRAALLKATLRCGGLDPTALSCSFAVLKSC